MNVCKIEMYVIDFDGLGPDNIKSTIENHRYPNDCISPNVVSVQEVDIGEWRDDHPLNMEKSATEEYHRLFDGRSIDADGWIEWRGGERPVPPETICEYENQSGVRVTAKADVFDWRWINGQARIVAYRVVK